MRRGPRVFRLVTLVAGVGFGCAAATAVSPTGGDGTAESVLFIGNSLTESNGLPARVADIAGAAGHPLRTSAVTRSGASLLDHWEDGRALRAIREGRWSVVVLQQGPSTLPESRAELIASTRPHHSSGSTFAATSAPTHTASAKGRRKAAFSSFPASMIIVFRTRA